MVVNSKFQGVLHDLWIFVGRSRLLIIALAVVLSVSSTVLTWAMLIVNRPELLVTVVCLALCS
jgi:hypothetical protein